MKSYILLIVLSVFSIVQGQTQALEVKGQVRGVTIGEISFVPLAEDSSYYGEDYELPSAKIINGKFVFKKEQYSKTALAYRCLIKSLDETYLTGVFLLKGGKQEILIESLNEYVSPKITTDSRLTEQAVVYQNKFQDFVKRFEQYNLMIDACDENEKVTADCNEEDIAVKMNAFKAESDSLFLSYARENAAAEFLLWKLIERIDNNGFDEDFKLITANFPSALLATAAGINLKQDVFRSRALSVKTKVLPFTLLNAANENTTIDTSYFKGKITLVEFWFTGCAPCERQFEALRKMQISNPNTNFQVLTISTDSKEKAQDWFTRVNQQDGGWKKLLDLDASFATAIAVNSFPTSFLVDEKGVVVARNMPMSTLEKLLFKSYSKLHIYREDGFEPE